MKSNFSTLCFSIAALMFSLSASGLEVRDSVDFINGSGSGGQRGSYESSLLPAVSNPAWRAAGGSGQQELVNGLLRIHSVAGTEGVSPTTVYYSSDVSSGNNFWEDGVDMQVGFTVEARFRIVDVDPNATAGAFMLNLFNSGKRVDISFGNDFISWRQGSTQMFTGYDMTSELVSVRVAYDPSGGEAGNGAYALWYNDTLLSDTLTAGSIASTMLRFGDPSQNLGGTTDIEYVRWDFTGAYAPIPEPSIAAILAGVFALVAIFRYRK